jgi:hypothetical protein
VFGKPKAKVSTSDGIHLFEKSSRNILMIFYMYIQCIGHGLPKSLLCNVRVAIMQGGESISQFQDFV